MTEIKYYTKEVNETLRIIYELREMGWQQGRDFEFRWNPTKWCNENFTFDEEEPAHCLFTFYEESLATWFTLKYI
jgi:hypothetical protein